MNEQLDPWRDADKLEKGELFLERAERLLFRRLFEYIIGENWGGARQVVAVLVGLKLV